MDAAKHEFEALREFCKSDNQRQIVDAVIQHGSNGKAAKKLGRSRQRVDEVINLLKNRAAQQRGPLSVVAPHGVLENAFPDPYVVPNGTLQIGPGGEVERYWPRFRADDQKVEDLLRASIDAMSEDIPREKPVKAPSAKGVNAELLNMYVITDYHIGMYSWAEETGSDWNVDIAEDLIVRWFKHAIEHAPPAGAACLTKLGDFLHWDGIDSVTPTSGHIVDADTRFQKLVRVGIRVTRRVVSMMLQKYQTVYIIEAEGNHDIASSMHSREWLAALYEDEPRVVVDTNADVYYCLEWGLTSLFFHHGHKKGPEKVDSVFVAKYREVFGRTKYSYAHMGHKHYRKELETNLMVVEQHRTLASPDSFASRGGWLSGREAKRITYHKRFGKCGEDTITPEMLEE